MGFLLASACASSPATPPGGESAVANREQPVASEDAAPPVTEVPSYLEPNYGEAGYAHVTEADMPWRIAIAYPRNSPKYGSRRDARNAALQPVGRKFAKHRHDQNENGPANQKHGSHSGLQ